LGSALFYSSATIRDGFVCDQQSYCLVPAITNATKNLGLQFKTTTSNKNIKIASLINTIDESEAERLTLKCFDRYDEAIRIPS
jgi:hypothetical protein